MLGKNHPWPQHSRVPGEPFQGKIDVLADPDYDGVGVFMGYLLPFVRYSSVSTLPAAEAFFLIESVGQSPHGSSMETTSRLNHIRQRLLISQIVYSRYIFGSSRCGDICDDIGKRIKTDSLQHSVSLQKWLYVCAIFIGPSYVGCSMATARHSYAETTQIRRLGCF